MPNNPKLTPKQQEEARRRYAAGGVTLLELATEYGCSIAPIYAAVSRPAPKTKRAGLPPPELPPPTPPIDIHTPELFDEGAIVRELVDRGGLHEFLRQFWDVIVPSPFVDNWHVGAMCEYLEAVTLGQIKNLVINVPPATGKPIEVSEPVWTKRGYIPLGDVVVGDEVLTHLGRWRTVTGVHEQGELPLLVIQTQSGRTVRTALDHPFLTPRGWVEAQDLTLEDTLGCVVEQGDHLLAQVTPEQARLCGYLVGDGGLSGHMVRFTNQEPDAVEDFCRVVEAQGWSVSFQTSRSRAKEMHVLSGERRGRQGDKSRLHRWIAEMGLERKTSYTKRIPPQILNGSKEVLAHFLGAYWTCDGSVEKRCDKPVDGFHGKHRGRAWRVTCTTVSEGLANDLLVALQRLGVQARLRTKISKLKSKKQGDFYKSFHIEVCGQDSVTRVSQLPGLCKRKQREFVRNEFDHTLLPDTVISITSGTSGLCRCLTVEEDHSFTAAGFAVHNTGLISIMWPAWQWTLKPETKYLVASFDQDLVLDAADKMILILTSERYQAAYPYIQLAAKNPARGHFKNTAGGLRFSTSPEGKATGRHVNFAIIDDPMKPQDAINLRKPAFDKVRTWFDGTLPTRAVDPKTFSRVVIMQRLHTDDLAGLCIERGYESLILPMRQVKRSMWARDPRKEVGELLWPERYPEEKVQELEIELGQQASAQLQQDPTPASGGFVEESWTRLEWIEPPERGTWVQSWDFSSKGTLESHSKVSGQLWCVTRELTMVHEYLSSLDERLAKVPGANMDRIIKHLPERAEMYVLVDWVGGLWNFVQSKAQFTMAQARPMWSKARIKLIELKANGPAIVEEMKVQFMGIKGVEPEGSKEERYRVHTEKWELGQVVYPPGPRKVGKIDYTVGADVVRQEHIKFPRFTHDDHVDTSTQALDRLANGAQRYRENLKKIAGRA